jgi:hypothetical protein
MSIAITAPEKFDFQDLVCVELMLRFPVIDVLLRTDRWCEGLQIDRDSHMD